MPLSDCLRDLRQQPSLENEADGTDRHAKDDDVRARKQTGASVAIAPLWSAVLTRIAAPASAVAPNVKAQ